MAKIYPFKYRFENPGIQPLNDDLWFKSHQELLLRIVNTPQGRDLLCIDKSFDRVPIVGFAKNRVTGFLGFEGKDRVKLISDFRVGAKWANIIRYRWRDFQALAKEHYSDRVNGQTEIFLNNKYRMAATTSTFYPNASGDPTPTSVDGYITNAPPSDVVWAPIHDAASGTSAIDNITLAYAGRIRSGVVSNLWDRIIRGMFLFDTSSLGTDSISSASLSLYLAGIMDNFSQSLGVVSANPASNIGLVPADYDQYGTTDFAARKALSSLNDVQYNDYAFNGDGLAAINKSGISKFATMISGDIDNIEPTWANNIEGSVLTQTAETAGTTQDPKLVVEHTDGGVGALVNGGLVNVGLIKGRLIN